MVAAMISKQARTISPRRLIAPAVNPESVNEWNTAPPYSDEEAVEYWCHIWAAPPEARDIGAARLVQDRLTPVEPGRVPVSNAPRAVRATRR